MKYRSALPQLGDDLFLTDSGLETTLVFHDQMDLPEFAAFPLLDRDDGVDRLRRYFSQHMDIAAEAGLGFIGEAASWRANPDWATKLGYDRDGLARLNRRSVELLTGLRDEYETRTVAPFVVSGCIGPRDDGYNPSSLMTPDVAQRYHAEQIETFRDAGADLVHAMTMTHTGEAIGIVKAAQAAGMPVVISFTTETDGRLPSGEMLADAVTAVDRATGDGPAYYGINCAHPSHFEEVIEAGGSWVERVRGLRANASRRSHAELDEAEDLDAGDPDELGADYARLRGRMPHLNVLGGCCGTDDRHVSAIRDACTA
jgi:S-methylmethionine-dependent homocysteine/selenocysteine methylase